MFQENDLIVVSCIFTVVHTTLLVEERWYKTEGSFSPNRKSKGFPLKPTGHEISQDVLVKKPLMNMLEEDHKTAQAVNHR